MISLGTLTRMQQTHWQLAVIGKISGRSVLVTVVVIIHRSVPALIDNNRKLVLYGQPQPLLLLLGIHLILVALELPN